LRIEPAKSIVKASGAAMPSPDEKTNKPKPSGKTPPLTPLPLVQNDEEETAAEMQELFDEDRVTHQHGGSEPEKD
jgi:hypothetical protein